MSDWSDSIKVGELEKELGRFGIEEVQIHYEKVNGRLKPVLISWGD